MEHPSKAHIARKYLDPELDKELSDLVDGYVIDESVEKELQYTLRKIAERYPAFIYEPLIGLYLQIKQEFYGKENKN